MTTLSAISSQSTIYIQVPITAPSNPTSASVSFAFLPYTSSAPVSSTTYYTGSWASGASYIAQCLVGPSGVVQLPASNQPYTVWVKIGTINSESPVLYCGSLQVT